MKHLLAALDDEIRVLEALVRCTQTEQQHLLAYEPEGLDLVLEEKVRLLTREDSLRTTRESLVFEHLARLGARGDDASLLRLIERLAEGVARPVAARRSRLRALLGALSELNVMAGYHAQRQLHWVQRCRKSLEAPQRAVGYGRTGCRDTKYGTGRVLDARV